MIDAGIFLALQDAHAAEGQCLHFVLAGHDAHRRDEFDVVLHTLRQHFGVGHAARQDDGVAVALEHDGQQANGLGDLIGLRLEDQVGVAVAVADHLLDDAAVARAEVGIHAAAAADLFPHFLIGIFAGIAELDEPERGHAAGALRGELAVVVADGVDDLAVAVHTGGDAAAEVRDDEIQLLIVLAVLTRIAQGHGAAVEHMAEAAALNIDKAGDLGNVRQLARRHGVVDIGGNAERRGDLAGQQAAEAFQRKLEALGVKVYRHYPIADYPSNINLIVSNEGYGRNEYIETSRPIVIVTAPGPGSGKMATCLSQLYQEHKRGVNAGYAKYETFPIWNLPLKHPVNLAYEAATADLADVNMIDPFHLEAYGETTVNYNRDIEIFPVLETIFRSIFGECPYKSPTDMGVNMAGFAICDDDACREASYQEIIRRYFASACAVKKGVAMPEELRKQEMLMNSLHLDVSMRRTVPAARAKAAETGAPAAAIELPDGRLVTGKTSGLMGASCAALLNAIKLSAGIDDRVNLISPMVLAPIQHLKIEHLGNSNPRLHTDEILIALSISAVTNPTAELAMEALASLRGSQVHSSVILSSVDEGMFKRLGMNVTFEPVYQSHTLYHK